VNTSRVELDPAQAILWTPVDKLTIEPMVLYQLTELGALPWSMSTERRLYPPHRSVKAQLGAL